MGVKIALPLFAVAMLTFHHACQAFNNTQTAFVKIEIENDVVSTNIGNK
jgi:hypothetical protein